MPAKEWKPRTAFQVAHAEKEKLRDDLRALADLAYELWLALDEQQRPHPSALPPLPRSIDPATASRPPPVMDTNALLIFLADEGGVAAADGNLDSHQTTSQGSANAASCRRPVMPASAARKRVG